MVRFETLSSANFEAWSRFRQALWEAHDDARDRADFDRYGPLHEEGRAVSFLAVDDDAGYVGLVDAELRRDYVEGTTSSPVWYVEGIYVAPEARSRGVGAGLIGCIEDLARSQGYREIASDCELDDTDSERFHKAVGFREALRTINLVKRFDGEGP